MDSPKDLPVLTAEELEMCKQTFIQFDKDGSGTIDVKELKMALTALGHNPSDEEVFVMISLVDQDDSKTIDFKEFVDAIRINRARSSRHPDEEETIDAFVVLGGKADMTGKVPMDRLLSFLKDFELSVDVQGLLGNPEELKKEIGYEEFKAIMH